MSGSESADRIKVCGSAKHCSHALIDGYKPHTHIHAHTYSHTHTHKHTHTRTHAHTHTQTHMTGVDRCWQVPEEIWFITAENVLILPGRCIGEFKCFSDTIRSQFEVLLKPFSSALSRTQNHTDKKTDKQTDKHIHRESRRTKWTNSFLFKSRQPA